MRSAVGMACRCSGATTGSATPTSVMLSLLVGLNSPIQLVITAAEPLQSAHRQDPVQTQ